MTKHQRRLSLVRNPRYHTFCVFGCLEYIYIFEEKITKLEPSSLKDVFIGYNESHKAYEVYISSQKKIVVHRDMKFDEYAWLSRSLEPLMEV